MKNTEIVELIKSSVEESIKTKFPESYWLRKDKLAEFPEEYHREMRDLGIFGLIIPEEYGGAGLRFADYVEILKHIAYLAGISAADLIMAYNVFAAYSILKFGNYVQKSKFLPKILNGEVIPSIGITEPMAGVNTFDIRTRAEYYKGEYIITGQKIWVTLAHLSNFLILVARTSEKVPNKPRSYGLTLFIINPKEHKNIKISRIDDIVLRPLGSCQVYIDGISVPEDAILGEKDNGWSILTRILNAERLSTSAMAIGTAELLLRKAVEYSKTRITFGKPLGSNQAIQFPLAEGKIMLEAAYQLLKTASEELEVSNEKDIAFRVNAASYLAVKAANQIADHTMQIFGGNSFAVDTGIEYYWRELRLLRVGPVPEQMILAYVAHNVLGMPRSF